MGSPRGARRGRCCEDGDGLRDGASGLGNSCSWGRVSWRFRPLLFTAAPEPTPVSLLGTAPTAYPRCGGGASAHTMGTAVWSSSRAPFRRMLRGMGATGNGIGPACCNELWPQLLVLLRGVRRRWWLVPSRPHGRRDYWRRGRGRVRRCLDGRSRGTVQKVN